MIQKTYQKIDSKIIEKWSQNGSLNGGTDMAGGLLFELFFWTFAELGFSRCQGPSRDPKWTILAPKMDPQSSQNGDQDPPADNENTTQANDA